MFRFFQIWQSVFLLALLTRPAFSQASPLSKISLASPQERTSTLPKARLGFRGEKIYGTAGNQGRNVFIAEWDIRRAKFRTMDVNKPIECFMTPLATGEYLTQDNSTYLDSRTAYFIAPSTGKISKMLSVGKSELIGGTLSLPNLPSIAFLAVNSPDRAQNHYLLLDAKTAKVLRKIFYSAASYAGQGSVFLSPDHTTLLINLSPDEGLPSGQVDGIDFQTGKLLFSRQPDNENQVADGVCYFLSPTKFVCGDRTLFNLTTRKFENFLSPNDRRERSVGGVGTRLGYAFFQTKEGMELWNVAKNKMLRRWPSIKQVEWVEMSPKLSTLAVHRGNTIEFWKFDPKWLR